MKKRLRVLIVEDSENDALLLLRDLRRAGFNPMFKRVDSAVEMAKALDSMTWDIVIADYTMPGFNALQALALVQERELDVPFIILSGTIGEAVAVAAMRAGAHDYIMKGNAARLIPAIKRELQDTDLRREKRRMEEALRQTQKLESLGMLAGGVAHDFNNLLVAMMGQCSMALSKVDEKSRAYHHLQKTMEAAERAADLTQQMLSYAGRGRFKMRPLCLNDPIRENLGLLSAAIPDNVVLQDDLLESLPLIVADASQMQQVVMNLILNAAEALDELPGTVAVRTGVVTGGCTEDCLWTYLEDMEPQDQYVMMEVEDTGVGMDADTVSKIFDPFFTTKESGRGLGLASVLGTVRGHKGGLCIHSQLGSGTTFKLLLPAMADAPQIKYTEKREARTSEDLILVIDDEGSVRDAISDILEMEGIGVVTAANGSDGVALYREQLDNVSLVVLDWSLPGMSGKDTLRELHDLKPNVPILLASGYSQAVVAEDAAGNGSVGFLQKPFNREKLLEAVQAHLGSNGDNGNGKH
jgi:signal transduction histidine kinase